MSYPDEDMTNAAQRAVPVEIRNWPANKGRGRPRKTTTKTYVLDPANPNLTSVQIAEWEPTRLRMVVQVIDAACAIIVDEAPKNGDTSPNATTAPGQGRYLPASTNWEYTFYGPDAFYLNNLGNATRVTVTKEYE